MGVGFEVSTAVVIKVAIFWDKRRVFLCERTCRRNKLTPFSEPVALWLLARVIFKLKVEVIYSSETVVEIQAARNYIREYGNINCLQ